MSNFMKIRQVGAGLFSADGRTNRHDEANSGFSQFCINAPKNSSFCPQCAYIQYLSMWLSDENGDYFSIEHSLILLIA